MTAQPALGATRRIGLYRLLQKVGEGGMGEVWLAEQTEPIRRRVALKIIKQGMDTKTVIARFEQERQALALMDHPCVAKVFDAGATPEGRPYFVMEYVQGLPINAHCDRHRLSTRDRLALFEQVCAAVQHAHQKAIIHRDLKPSNVLVSIQDNKAVPKIIDFGVAKATAQRLTERSLFTELGVLVGTPEYMSPEQADLTAQDVDTRTDVYSLGVMLYELLVGALPFESRELRQAGIDEMRRIIRETDPPAPSARLSGLSETAGEVARRRGTEPGSLERLVRGELDWIVMRAMEKDRTHRYQSASELAADIGHYLSDEPVVAGPPSARYRFRKLVLRHRLAIASGALVVAALILGLAATSIMYVRARAAESRAVWKNYVANVRSADLSLAGNNILEARRSLAACDFDLRGWEWRHLFFKVDSSLAVLHAAAAIYSADGKIILTYGGTSGLQQYDASTFKLKGWTSPLNERDGKGQPVEVVAVDSSGSRAVETPRWSPEANSEPLVLVDVSTGVKIAELMGTAASPGGIFGRHVFFSRDGRWLVYGELPGERVSVFEAKTGKQVLSLPSGKDRYGFAAAVFRDGGRLLSKHNGDFLVWELPSGRLISKLQLGRLGRAVSELTVSEDGSLVVTAVRGAIDLWDGATGKRIRNISGHEGFVTTLALSPDGRLIASGGSDKTVRLWDTSTGDALAVYQGCRSMVRTVSFSSTGNYLIASSALEIRLWDVHSDGTGSLLLPNAASYSIAISPDGSRLICETDAAVLLINPETGEVESRVGDDLPGRNRNEDNGDIVFSDLSPHYLMAVNADASLIALCARDGKCRILGLRSGQREMIVQPDEEDAAGVAFSSDGRTLAVGLDGGNALLWDYAAHKSLGALVGHEGRVLSLVFNPDGQTLVTGGGDGRLIVWDLSAKKPRRQIRFNGTAVTAVAFNREGDILAVGTGRAFSAPPDGGSTRRLTSDNHIILYQNATGKELGRLRGHEGSITSIVFHPSDERIATGSLDGTIRVWDTRTFEPLIVLKEVDFGAVTSALFTPDGTRLISSHWGGGVHVWETRSGQDPILLDEISK